MDFFSFNYKPKDFKGKSTKDILAMKPTKVGDDFFTKYAAEIKEGDQSLSEDELSAVQLLSDLKDKTKILEKCYTKRTKQSVVPGHHSIKKHHQEQAAVVPAAAAAAAVAAVPEEDVELPVEDKRELVPEQTGGRRRTRKHARSRTTRSQRKSRKLSGGRRRKLSSRRRIPKSRRLSGGRKCSGGRKTKRMRKRTYRGGVNLQQIISPLPTKTANDMAIPLDNKLDIKLDLTPNAKP